MTHSTTAIPNQRRDRHMLITLLAISAFALIAVCFADWHDKRNDNRKDDH